MLLQLSNQNTYYNFDKRYSPSAMEYTHFHPYHELYFLEKGKTTIFLEDRIYLLNEGDMLFVPKHIIHKTDNMNTKLVKRHLFKFDDTDFDDQRSLQYIQSMKESHYIKLSPEHVHFVTSIARKMSYELEHKYTDHIEMQKLYLRQLFIILSRFQLIDAQPHTNDLQQTIQNTLDYINANLNTDLSLHILAAKCNVSPGYLSKQFKNLIGVGVSEYINIARVTAAEKLLANTNMPITQVAFECGFNDSNYFARVFKNLRGITPKKFSMQEHE